jgi:drug/metabolite transporter (DMT)-like permease
VNDHSRAVAAASVTVVLWASAFVSIRGVGAYLAPGALAFGRLIVASLALGAVWLISDRRWPARAAWPGILGSGLLWFGLYMVTLNWGERDVDAGTAAMLVNIGPVLIALLGGWLLREGYPRRLAAGMAVSFGGAVVVGASESGGRATVAGVALCLAAAVCYAAGVVLQKPALRYASAIQVTTFGCLVGTAACLPFAGQLASRIGQAPPAVILNVAYLGLFPTTLGFVTWAYALARTTSGKMGATTYAVPGLVVVMSWLILGQAPRWLTIVGGILCLAGVAVSRSRDGKYRAASLSAQGGEAAPLPVSAAQGHRIRNGAGTPLRYFDRVAAGRDCCRPAAWSRRPPDALADGEQGGRDQHRADEQGVEQDADGHGGPDLGEVDRGFQDEGGEGGGEDDAGGRDDASREAEPAQRARPGAQLPRFLPDAGGQEDVVVDAERHQEDEDVHRDL